VRWFAPLAVLPGGVAHDVLLEESAGRFTTVAAGSRPDGATVLPGVVLPGFANCHSHAFHRALRGRTNTGGGTFWTWRERMYALAARLDPDSYYQLARAVYAELALAGFASVGEFHYLHHGAAGRPYDDPNAMGSALIAAARDAGVRLTLLDACYLSGGLAGEALNEVQQRFSDGDVGRWAERVNRVPAAEGVRHAIAVHSVRAVPRAALGVVAGVADGRPLHVHVSEQLAENAACLAVHGLSPTGLLAEEGLLGASTTAVHAVHVDAQDVALLAAARTTVCVCPTTEHDLADGVAPARVLADAGVRLSLGSDQHVVIDPFAEAQRLEADQRASSFQRGRFAPSQLLDIATAHDSLGWDDAGALAVGMRADLVAVRLDSVRTAGIDPAEVILAATAADIDTVVVDGASVVTGGRHRLGDVGRLLADAIGALT
jgi:formiminoglutamate deiminase